MPSARGAKTRKGRGAKTNPVRRPPADKFPKNVLDLSTDWYWQQDERHRFTKISGRAFAKAGFEAKEYLGRVLWDHGASPVGDHGSWDRHKATLKARQPFADFLFKRPTAQGELRYISSSGQPIYDRARRFRGYRGIAKDVTQRIQTELRLTIEHGVTHALAASDSIGEAAPQIIRLICETLGWACGTLWGLEERSETLHCVQTWGIGCDEIADFLAVTRRLPPQRADGGGLIRATWAKGEPQWIHDVTQEASFVRGAAAVRAGLHSAFAFPIKVGERVIGVMEFFSQEIHQPDAELLNGTRYIGSQIGQFNQRKQAEEVLRESEARFRSLTELSSDWYWEQDENLRFTKFSGGRVGNASLDFSGIIGKTRWELTGLEVDAEARAALQAKLDAREPFYDFEYRHAQVDATARYFATSGTPVFNAAGRFTGYRGVAKDITERKRDEQLQALEHAVNRCLAEADSASAAIQGSIRAMCATEGWECGRCFRVDESAGLMRFADAWGLPDDPLIARYIEASRDVTYEPGVGINGRVWQSGEPLWVSERGQHAGIAQTIFGKPRDVFIFPLLADGKTIGALNFISRKLRPPDARLLQTVRVIGSQIGQFIQRKQAEEALRENEARFRSLTELSSDWYWEQDAEFRFSRFEGTHVTGDNSAFKNELGKTREQIGVEVEGGWEAHRALLEQHQPFRDVVMWRTVQDAQRHYMSISGEPMFDAGGRFLGYRGVGKDVTERKRGERILALEHTVNRCLADAEKPGAALQAVLRVVCESEGWECGRYYSVDEAGGTLQCTEGWGIADPAVEQYLAAARERVPPLERGLKGRSYRTKEPQWGGTDTGRHEHLAKTHLGGARDTFIIPAVTEGRVIGLLCFTNRALRKPDARLMQAARVIGSQIGQFMQRKHTELTTLRIARMFAALSATNDAILHAKSPEELYQRVCDAAVHGGKFSNISILLAEPGETRTKAVASAGRVPEQLRASHISIDETIPEGRGLVGIAYRSQRPCVSNDFLHDDRTQPWHEIGHKANCLSAAALPLTQAGRSIGAVLIHDHEVNAFDDEIVKLLERLAENISFALDNFEREAERRRAEERVQYLATHDGLTDLPNRVMFSQLLNLAIQSARRYERRFAVLFLDLDRFKIINDTLGHEAGDMLLQEMAKRLKENLRASDVVARLGGDEFVVLLQEVNEAENVATVARKLLSTVIRPVVILGQECRVTASIGISMYPTDAQDEQGLMKNADMAMYLAKEEGKNNFQFYSGDIKAQSVERLALEMSLRHAMERDEFFLHYQAKLNLSSGAISGVEALLRWKHPELGLVSPAHFIPLAEETGLIVPIGKWVLKTACEQNVAWQRAGLPPVCMAINLSPRQFADENLLSDLHAVLKETGMAPELLELEITESMVMGNIERAAKQLTAIKNMGVRLAIDDFGTGYSSLAQIKRFPIDTIKVDRSFIREIPKDAEDKAITQAIIAMGKSLSLTVVAEGVETEEQQNFLRQQACNEMQGYYFSKPVAPEDFAELLRNHVPAPG